jgi:Tol biopolymer transport system component
VFEHQKLAIIDLRGHERFLRIAVGAEARAPTFSPDGRLIAFVNRHASYLVSFVDARTGKPVGRWIPGVGFGHADPTWDRTGVYIPTG